MSLSARGSQSAYLVRFPMFLLARGSLSAYLIRIPDVFVGQRVTVSKASVEHQASEGTQRDDNEHSGSVHQQGAGESRKEKACTTRHISVFKEKKITLK